MGYMQYKLRQQELEERRKARQLDVALSLLKISTEKELRETAINLDAAKSLYAENQKILSDSESELKTMEATYHEAVGSLDNLDKIYKSTGKDVTKDIYKGEVTDYQARADHAFSNNEAIKNKIIALQDVLFTDINRAKQIVAGGAGFEGGVQATQWDPGDLGIVAYEAEYGPASSTVEMYFKNNPGLMRQSLAKLRKDEAQLDLTAQKTVYYGSEKDKRSKNEVELIFGTALKTASIDSQKNNYDNYSFMESNFTDDTPPEEKKSIKTAQFKIINKIGDELFKTLLNQDVTDAETPSLVSEYFDIYDHATKEYETGIGITAEANYAPYLNYVKMAADNYQQASIAGNEALQRQLNDLARIYFGMPYGAELSVFARDMETLYNKMLTNELDLNFGLVPEDNTIFDTKTSNEEAFWKSFEQGDNE